MAEKKRALLSVSDKTGIVEFARELCALGYEIVSTGGTFEVIGKAGIAVRKVSDITGFPEILGGRVKTLHPNIHAGILAADTPEHLEELRRSQIEKFGMVVVNLYPFEKVASKKEASESELVENIDIGGPAMLRAAAKNFDRVTVVTSPSQYQKIIEELRESGIISLETRRELATEAFVRAAKYDIAIATEFQKRFGGEAYPRELFLHFTKLADLRYGENPHQTSAFYSESELRGTSITNSKQLHGKQLSFNNILDGNDALELVRDFERPTVTIVKHTNPCGVASADDISTAYDMAMAADPLSAFGGVIALNRPMPVNVAGQISKLFVELVIAPAYEPGTLEILKKKKNVRIIETGELTPVDSESLDVKKLIGGALVQTRNVKQLDMRELKVVTERKPTGDEQASMEFAWKVLRHVKSNSIVFAKGSVTVGIGAGQMSRVDAVKIASFKAGEKARGSAMASDAFFPFRDGIDEAAKAGVTAVIQPGGSIRDAEVIAAANEHKMAMAFTGIREFKH